MAMDINIKKTNTYLVKSIGIKDFPLTGKLCAVDIASKKFKLGKLTFLFDTTPSLSEIKEFLEEFLVFKIDTPLLDEYFEDVKVVFINDKSNILYETLDGFVGIVAYNDIGIILKVGVELPKDNHDFPMYVFRYYPQNLSISSNNFNLLELTNKV